MTEAVVGSPCDIFISYRRFDSAIFSQWLAAQLRDAYGQDCVFIDAENIRDATVWAQKIQGSLDSASVVIVVIGKSWLTISDEFGRRRIDMENDWVRREVESSLQKRKNILPLLIEGAELPDERALPPSIVPLLDIQTRRINVNAIAKDMAALVERIGALIGRTPVTLNISYPAPILQIKALDDQNLRRAIERLPAWRVVKRTGEKGEKTELMRTFQFQSFRDAIHFMNTASRFIEQIDHHPEWTNVWQNLIVYLTTFDIGFKPSMLDVDLATYLDDLYNAYTRKISRQDIADLRPVSSSG
jgi:pterin-4a-carbinolamine dehydratase